MGGTAGWSVWTRHLCALAGRLCATIFPGRRAPPGWLRSHLKPRRPSPSLATIGVGFATDNLGGHRETERPLRRLQA